METASHRRVRVEIWCNSLFLASCYCELLQTFSLVSEIVSPHLDLEYVTLSKIPGQHCSVLTLMFSNLTTERCTQARNSLGMSGEQWDDPIRGDSFLSPANPSHSSVPVCSCLYWTSHRPVCPMWQSCLCSTSWTQQKLLVTSLICKGL